MKKIMSWLGRILQRVPANRTEELKTPAERLRDIEERMERILRELADYHGSESKARGEHKDPEALYRSYREGMREDLFDLMAFVATWDGALEGRESALIRQVTGELVTEKEIFDRARKVEREMELWEPECGGSGTIRALTRYDSDRASAYTEALLEAGALLSEDGRMQRGRLPLDLMAIYLGAQRTQILVGRLGRYDDFGEEEREEERAPGRNCEA